METAILSTGGKLFLPYFMSEFHDRLLRPNGNNPVRDRASGFKKIFAILDEKAMEAPGCYFRILETGTIRPDHGELCFGDDGCSTVIFDSFVCQMGGEVLSVDISPENVEYARKHVSANTMVYCEDSIKQLYGIHDTIKYDLIYLDSYDIIRDNPHPSQLHHLKELCASLKNTRSGTIICIDDHDAFFTGGQIGKGNYVKSFMDGIGAKEIHIGYQAIWLL